MAAENEYETQSQGLKIAVAAFISLSVILTVTLHFMYASYNSALARADAAQAQNRQLIAEQKQLLLLNEKMKKEMAKLTAPSSK
jgi:cell division protein FtsB